MKKAQIQLGESISVIVIVIILLIIGIVFWAKVSSQDSETIITESQELSVIEIANSISEFRELKCYEADVGNVKCLDYYKLLAMENLTNDNPILKQYYNSYFKNSKITIQLIYPPPSPANENITVYDAKLNQSTKTLLIPIPVNVKDYTTGKVTYGLILVEGYYNE